MSQQNRENAARGVRKRSPLEIAKSVFFVLFVCDILVLYVIYLYNVKDNPSFSHFQKLPPVLIGFLVLTGLFLIVYLVWFIVTMIMTFVFFCQLNRRSRLLFLYSLLMLLICIGTLIFGVYSPFYSNGQIFMFFIALFNIYVWSLVYLNWPTELTEMINLEEFEMEIRFSRQDNNEPKPQGYDMSNNNASANGGNSGLQNRHGRRGEKLKIETEEESKTDNSQIVGTGTRDI